MKKIYLVFLTAIISGFSIYINKFAVSGIDSTIFTFLKNFLVGLLLMSIVFLRKEKIPLKELPKLLFIGLIGGSIPFILYFKGLQITNAASASMIHKTMFLYVLVLALFFLKEKINIKILTATIMLLVGNYLMIKPNFTFNYGDLLILIATLFWALENVISKHILKNLSGNIVAFGRMFFGSFFILAYIIFINKIDLIFKLTTQQIYWVFITTGILALYVLTWYNGLKYVNVSLATSILLLGSPITSLLYLADGKIIEITNVFGSLLIGLGILFYIVGSGYKISYKLPWKA